MNYSNVVSHVNTTILDFVQKNTFTALGPAFKQLTHDECVENLILHRMSKKFAEPVTTVSEERKSRTIKSMVDYDTAGISDFVSVVKSIEDPFLRRQLYNARKTLHEALSHYRFSVSSLEFPNGETYVSAGGDVSLYAKLRDIKQWCVTPDCFDLFAQLCYQSPMLKYAARRHLRTWLASNGKRFDNTAMFQAAKELDRRNWRFLVFKAKLRCVVTFVPGARITTVPKDLLVDRVIECDAFCNMCVQLAIDGGIKKMIQNYFDVDLKSSQLLHKLMLADHCNATIDFSNASNSTWNSVVKWFLGTSRLGKDLQAARCGYVELPDGTLHCLQMLSPMGNGFTFSVMTLLLLCVSRQFDSFSHVFGDDVILDNYVAPSAIELFQVIGYRVNETKTFVDSDFRESCGGFIHTNTYIQSFDFVWAEDITDAIILINKVRVLLVRYPWLDKLQELHANLVEGVPSTLLRAYDPPKDWPERVIREVSKATLNSHDRSSPTFVVPLPPLYEGVWLPRRKVLRLQKNDAKCQQQYKKLRASLVEAGKVSPSNVHIQPYLLISRHAKCYRTKSGAKMQPTKNVSRLFGWFYVFNGRVQAPTLRQEVLKYTWTFEYI